MPRILISGVSTGIGRACANRFAHEGWGVTGTLRDVARRPEGLDERVVLEALDLGEPGSAQALASRVLDAGGCPDVVLNNAGMVRFAPLEGHTQDDLLELFQVNVFGQMELIRALLPAMRERGSGTIANVTSLGGTMTFPFFAGYNATKWAFEGISEGLWHELKPFGIRVKAIEPGFVETAVWGKVIPEGDGDPLFGTPYAPHLRSMLEFERSIASRTAPDEAAAEVWLAVTDTSDRLRYPIAAYARPLIRVRRLVGDRATMRFMHGRWFGAGGGS